MKRIICFLMCIALISISFLPITAETDQFYSNGATGEVVVRIQLRLAELGYLFYKPTGAYRSMTVEAVKAFQQRCCDVGMTVTIDGVMGQESMAYLFSADAPRAKIPDSVHIAIGPTKSELEVKGEITSWSEVKSQLVEGQSYEVIDCYTGKEFTLIYGGGENHAEMEIANEDCLDNFMAVCGGEFNFYKRPIVVKIGSKNVAASMQCYPHGTDYISGNGMDGHICVYFSGSLSHVGNLPDTEHESIIKQFGK